MKTTNFLHSIRCMAGHDCENNGQNNEIREETNPEESIEEIQDSKPGFQFFDLDSVFAN